MTREGRMRRHHLLSTVVDWQLAVWFTLISSSIHGASLPRQCWRHYEVASHMEVCTPPEDTVPRRQMLGLGVPGPWTVPFGAWRNCCRLGTRPNTTILALPWRTRNLGDAPDGHRAVGIR
ncbi:hypothetical protein BD413DRAFT_273989 [Trametes elegans]|nr:hypothetical protein BD413DRAFT_273989 [Trametes elegans]